MHSIVNCVIFSLIRSLSVRADNVFPRIYHGLDVKARDYRFYVALASGDTQSLLKYRCNGAFITAQWIITVAHCIWQRRVVKVAVAIDSWASLDFRVMIQVDRKIIHPTYSERLDHNRHDLALVKLPEGYSSMFNLSLPLPSDDMRFIDTGDLATIISMGSTVTDNGAPINDTIGVLKRIDVPLKQTTCARTNNFSISRLYYVCLVSFPPQDQLICEGDSGSAGYSQIRESSVVLAITSSGDHECDKGFFHHSLQMKTVTLFVRITSYTPWILHVLDQDSDTNQLLETMSTWMIYPHLASRFFNQV